MHTSNPLAYSDECQTHTHLGDINHFMSLKSHYMKNEYDMQNIPVQEFYNI